MGDGGKGSRPRPFSVDQKTFDNNWDNIFNRKKKTDAELFEEAIMKNEYYDLDDKVIFECGDCGWSGEVDVALPNENLDGHTCPSCGSEL